MSISAVYHPEIKGSLEECAKARDLVDCYKSINDKITAIVDDPNLTRSQIKHKLTELTMSYFQYLTARQGMMIYED